LRGYITLALLGIKFLLADFIQRTLIVVLVRLRPTARERILSAWIRYMARDILSIATRVGGAKISRLPKIPTEPGTLILMNHQSLLDIPVVTLCLESSYAVIVTRRRYTAQYIPVISQMVRLFGFPTVEPRNPPKKETAALGRKAANVSHPLVLFPEGNRTRDGKIGPFKKLGLRSILASRSWRVYLVVLDGFWQTRSLGDFAKNCETIRAEVRLLGPFGSPPGDETDSFIDAMRERMCDELQDIRAAGGPGKTNAEKNTKNSEGKFAR